MSSKVVIVGAGAAGLMAAACLTQAGIAVSLIESNSAVGKKILISGGGRCNFTNTKASHNEFVSQNTHFSKSSLARYSASDFIDLVKKYNISFHEKKLGQLFCDKSAKDIVSILLNECDRSFLDLRLNTKVLGLDSNLKVNTDKGDIEASHVIISSGGLSIPSIGASDIGLKIAKNFDMKLVETRPALVPLTLNESLLEYTRELSGVSVSCVVQSNGVKFSENILFTHKGLSGPAILQISLHWNSGDEIEIDFIPELNLELMRREVSRRGAKKVENWLCQYLPERFVMLWWGVHELSERKGAEWSRGDWEKFESVFKRWRIIPSGTEGYRKAEVTRGGVHPDELSSKTLESKKMSNVYFVGEVVDVTGWLGGYNFQWAWSSAVAASDDIIAKLS